MDNIEKIIKLAEIGYTKDEIEKFLNLGKAPEQLEIKEPEPEKKAEEIKAPVPDYNESLNDMFKPYLDNMEKMLKTIQAANIRAAEMGEVKPYTGLDAMAEIIAPRKK